MDKVTQAGASSAEENAAASEELNAQAVTLQDMAAQLQALVAGGASRRSVSAPTATATINSKSQAMEKKAGKRSIASAVSSSNRDEAHAAFGQTLQSPAKPVKPDAAVASFNDF